MWNGNLACWPYKILFYAWSIVNLQGYFLQKYLVHDINSPIHFHQTRNIFFTNFGVMIISMMLWNAFWSPPQDLEKVVDFNPEKTKSKWICQQKNSWIGELMSQTRQKFGQIFFMFSDRRKISWNHSEMKKYAD
jgi:hypothetical protein